jgi:hypothetical protein
MSQLKKHNISERLLSEPVGKEPAYGKTINGLCDDLAAILKIVGSHHFLNSLQSMPVELLRCREDLENVLAKVKTFPGNQVTERPGIVALDQENAAMLRKLCDVRTALAKCQTRLTEREVQIVALIDDGLRMAFKKETFEKRVSE